VPKQGKITMEKQLSQYKKIVAEQTLEIVVLKDVIEKKL
jgi:putative transposase